MLRMLGRLLVVVLLGVLTTIAVAWWCGWRSDLDPAAGAWGHVALDPATGEPVPSLAGDTVQPGVNVHLQRGFGVAYLGLSRSDGMAKFEHHVALSSFWPSFGPLRGRAPHELVASGRARDLLAQGWPFLALWCEKEPMAYRVTGGLHIATEHIAGSFLSTEHVLAMRPSWPGFLGDTALYGAAWSVLLLALRRALTRPGRTRSSSP